LFDIIRKQIAQGEPIVSRDEIDRMKKLSAPKEDWFFIALSPFDQNGFQVFCSFRILQISRRPSMNEARSGARTTLYFGSCLILISAKSEIAKGTMLVELLLEIAKISRVGRSGEN
jgi:hypothetical protein